MANDVNIYNKNYNVENFHALSNQIFKLVLKVTSQKNKKYTIAVIFISKKKSLELNMKYRNKDYVADVLSFPIISEDYLIQGFEDLGDVYICYSKAKKQAKEYQHSLNRELAFLFLHGLLHNLGYDHKTETEEKEMFGLQKLILNKLKITRSK